MWEYWFSLSRILAYITQCIVNFEHIQHNNQHIFEMYSEPCQTSTMERFEKIVNGF